MALLAGHKCFEDFTTVAAKAGIADGYPGATKARTIIWACIVVSYLLHTFQAYSILYCTRPEGRKHPRASAVNTIRHGKRVVTSTC